METNSPDRTTLIVFLLTVLLAGNNAIAVKYSNAELPPFFGAAIRFGLAAVILFFLMVFLRLPFPRGRSLQGAVIFGILSTGLNYAFIYWALETVPAGLSMVFLALTPLLTFLFAWARHQETFRWNALAGSALALGGIGIIAWNQINAHVNVLALLALLGGAICFSAATVLIKGYPKTHPVTTNAVATLSGSLLLFVFSALGREAPTLPKLAQTWAAFGYLVIFGSVIVFAMNLYVIKRWTASASSYLFVLMPIVTISVAAWLTGEGVTITFLLGGALVLAGAYLGGIAKAEQLRRIYSSIIPRIRPRIPTGDCYSESQGLISVHGSQDC